MVDINQKLMVDIKKIGDKYVFEISGFHKLWAFKSELTIPADHIISVTRYDKERINISGIRMPGTQIPGVITAGTFIEAGQTIFCDITNPLKTIVVKLNDERYKKLIVEVDNPDNAIRMLTEQND